MDPSAAPDPSIALPFWLVASLPWLGAAILLAVSVGVVGVWMLVSRAREVDRLSERLEVLDDLRSAVRRMAQDREDLDVRRIEHVLLEIRDGQRRVEDALLRAVESTRAPAIGPGGSLSERVITRLLAQGYEHVQLVTPVAELEARADGDEPVEVLVEARREGVLQKGRVVVREGALTEVEMKPAYSIFP